MNENTTNHSQDHGGDFYLSQEHLAMLHASAIVDAVIQARGYRTIRDAKDLVGLGFASSQRQVPGLLIPLHTTDGESGLYVYQPDNPRVVEDKKKRNTDGTYTKKVIKYEMSKGASIRLDCPPACRSMLPNPSIPLWIIEGQKKADSLASVGLCAIALLGVWNFKGKNEYGASTFLNDWSYVALEGRNIHIVFDSDMLKKREVRQAFDRLKEHLQKKGANVTAVYLPDDPHKGKVGVDDWLADGHTVDELNNLVDAPRPQPKPAPDKIELLDNAPATISRPLALIEGHAYAATWLYVRVISTEDLNKQGEIIKYDPPIEVNEQRLFIIRDDGAIFSDTTNPIENLPLKIHLPEIPPAPKLWSAKGVKAYLNGRRPDPLDVFTRLTEVVDKFIDFNRSLAPQRVMSEAIACYILSTWFLDAFNVVGFLWPNGDRGSGKTHLLLVVSELSYLGQLILAGGSFASLRDLADYGATLAFDDAENTSDSKSLDPDKRALLLAGNRRGATVTLKELRPDKKWETRYVNAYCPRLFSAIRLPDPILASRTIIIPLIRTPDRKRANIDPLDYAAWPHDHQQLIDDLWAQAVNHLADLPKYDEWVGKNASLTGRNLQPWRGILSVAKWLDDLGVSGLWQRMDGLSEQYQNERPQLEVSDFTVLVIRSLLDWFVANVANVSNVANPSGEFKTSTITDIAHKNAEETDGDIDPDKVTSQRIGQVLKKMRLEKVPRPHGQGCRTWKISRTELVRWAQAYGIPVPDYFEPNNQCPSTEEKATNNEPNTPNEIGDIGNIGDIGDELVDADLYEGEI